MYVYAFTFTSASRRGNIRFRVTIIRRVESSSRRGDFPLLEQLFPKEEILRSQGTAGMCREPSQSDQIDDDQRQGPRAVCHGVKNRGARHERSGLHVTERYPTVFSPPTKFLRTTPSYAGDDDCGNEVTDPPAPPHLLDLTGSAVL